VCRHPRDAFVQLRALEFAHGRCPGSAVSASVVDESPAVTDRLRLFSQFQWLDLKKPGTLSRARKVQLAQTVLGDAVQVAITFALVAGMKSSDTATLLSLYTSTLSLSSTLGTELWQVLHCARDSWESRHLVKTSPRPTETESAAIPAALETMPRVPGPAARSSGSSGCGPCDCVVECLGRGPCSCCCHSPACRTVATSRFARVLCVAFVAFLLVFTVAFNQLRLFSSGIASVRMELKLSVRGPLVLPNGRATQVTTNETTFSIIVPVYRSQYVSSSDPIEFGHGANTDRLRFKAVAHNEQMLTVAAGFDVESVGFGNAGLGCALLWQHPDPRDPNARAEIPVGKFAENCATRVGASGGTKIPRGQCVYSLGTHSVQAPYDPRGRAGSGRDPEAYESYFGSNCAQLTHSLFVEGSVEVTYMGTCDLSGVI
jgi:hypothetical protein